MTQLENNPATQSIALAHIAAISTNRCIGKDNDLPWHISADLKHFKKLTQGGVMVLGRKTYDSFGGRPLPKRSHWVVSRQADWQSGFVNTSTTQVHHAHSLAFAIERAALEAQQKNLDKVWIIGGAQIFNDTISLVSHLEITHVAAHVEGDAFYPPIPKEFKKIAHHAQHDDASGLDFAFSTYIRKMA